MPKRKKRRTHVKLNPETDTGIPKSFVIKMGRDIGPSVSQLVRDVRKVLEPNTASKLKERKSQKLKDFVAVASQLGVTHYIILSRTERGVNLKVARHPRGPTLTFRVSDYSLARDVLASLRRPHTPSKTEFQTGPLLVLSGFGQAKEQAQAEGGDKSGKGKEVDLMVSMFQNLFPPINVQNMKLSSARRVVLLSYNPSDRSIDFRHYSIQVKVAGVSRAVRKVLQTAAGSVGHRGGAAGEGEGKAAVAVGRKGKGELPDLGKYADVSEFVLKESSQPDSDYDSTNEDPSTVITLPQDYLGRGNRRASRRRVRLVEVGPRMTWRLMKVEAGLGDGEVVHHEFVKKTPAQVAELRTLHATRAKEKAERRRQQEENVERKRRAKEKSADGEDEGETVLGKRKKRGAADDEEGEDSDRSSDDGSDDDDDPYADLARRAALDRGSASEDSDVGSYASDGEDEVSDDDGDDAGASGAPRGRGERSKGEKEEAEDEDEDEEEWSDGDEMDEMSGDDEDDD
ncbi:Brix-domain-containing protein [Gonapodya prolifera JEL478]|uniref:Brix-domain-containing protein n=1 Tax=Gonapodya prolifera (strain JEL478) TaxID=1344416 RepID=A0A139AGH1_GONPJ|nr:Brix-domain-containing protein [Gonapodya prolifera JEL478]|eukprot:KXS15789.1 Brix-domain-containing protein [Gonapodya prolifera JEL478]